MLEDKFVSNYLQFWRSYLSATAQFTPYVQNVHYRPKRTLAFSNIFPQTVGNFLVQILQTHYTFLPTLGYNFFYLINSNCDEVMPY